MWTRFSGLLGLIIFLFGFITSVILGQFGQPLLFLHMIVGFILMAFWFFAYGISNINQTGQVLKGRTVRYGFNAILYSLVVTGLLGVVYYLSIKHDKRWDLTENSIYSLSPQTSKIIKNLKEPLKIVAFTGIAQIDENALEDTLRLYKYENPDKITTELIDARTKPYLVDKYEMKTGNVIYLEYGEGDKKAVSRINESNEQGITNAIIKLSRGAAKKIYYVIGHDEPDIKSDQAPGLSAFASAISDEHLTIDTILLSQSDKIPADAAAVILCSPKRSLLSEEIEVLKKYADNGGRLLMFADPNTAADVRTLSQYFGITVGDDVIIDQVQRLFAAPALGAQPVVRTYAPHPITSNLKADDITVYNIASSVTASPSQDKNVKYTELAKTGGSAWAEKDLARLFDEENPSASFDNGIDSPGPVSLAVAYEKKLSESKKSDDKQGKNEFDEIARVVVFGDSDWILNANFNVYSNRDLALSALNWLAGEEGGVSIAAKSMRASDAQMTRDDFMLLLAASFVIPEIILIFGLFIWWRRKSFRG